MFKTREELKNQTSLDSIIREKAIDDAFSSFAERIEFYKKYINVPALLEKENDKAHSKYFMEDFGNYRNWLFDYCFGDIKHKEK